MRLVDGDFLYHHICSWQAEEQLSAQAHLGLYPPLAMRSRPFPEGIMGLTNRLDPDAHCRFRSYGISEDMTGRRRPRLEVAVATLEPHEVLAYNYAQ